MHPPRVLRLIENRKIRYEINFFAQASLLELSTENLTQLLAKGCLDSVLGYLTCLSREWGRGRECGAGSGEYSLLISLFHALLSLADSFVCFAWSPSLFMSLACWLCCCWRLCCSYCCCSYCCCCCSFCCCCCMSYLLAMRTIG